MFHKRPEKELDPAKKPGQIINRPPESLLYKPVHGGYPDSKKVCEIEPWKTCPNDYRYCCMNIEGGQ